MSTTNSTFLPTTAVVAAIVTAAPTHADLSGFTGFYAPDTWTITGAGIGGSSAIFATDGSGLVITGADGAMGSPETDVTHIVATDGIWFFNWTFLGLNGSPGFDAGFYLHNGTAFLLSDGIGTHFGSVAVAVEPGDVIGYRLDPSDGLFGPGILTITDFRIIVPGPATFALLGIAGLTQRRRR